MMRLGVATGALRVHTDTQEGFRLRRHRPLDVWGMLDKVKAWGADGAMLSVNELVSTDPKILRDVRAQADASGLYLEVGVRFAQLENLRPWIEAAAILGSPVLRIVIAPFGNGQRWRFQGEPREYLATAAAKLCPLGRVAADRGVRIVVENHMDFILDEYRYLFDQLDPQHFGVCLDTANPLGTVEHPDRVCRALAPLVASSHIKDYLPVWTPTGYRLLTCPIGDGAIDNAGIIEALASHHPDLSLNLELPVFSVREIPIFSKDLWAAYGQRRVEDVMEVIELVTKAQERRPTDCENGLEKGWSEDLLLEAEEHCVRRSILRARELFAPWLN